MYVQCTSISGQWIFIKDAKCEDTVCHIITHNISCDSQCERWKTQRESVNSLLSLERRENPIQDAPDLTSKCSTFYYIILFNKWFALLFIISCVNKYMYNNNGKNDDDKWLAEIWYDGWIFVCVCVRTNMTIIIERRK